MADNAVEFSMNVIVDRILRCFDEMMIDSSLEELEKKKSIVLLRSAKENILCGFLDYFERVNYTGDIHIIGRKSDEKCFMKYNNLKISMYVVDDMQMYSIENTENYIKQTQAEAICFLYQNKISIGHDNLLKIVNQVNCDGYAVSNQLKVVKFIGLNKYITGKRIYDELCDWYCQKECPDEE